MLNKELNLLGIACKAGFLVAGEDSVILSLQKKKVKIVFIGSDASTKTIKRFENKCSFYKVPCIKKYTSEELGKAIGKSRKVIGVTDINIANAIIKILEDFE